uniref:NADH dehydrogenase subunit 3 n=1 Tax=Diplonema japonicum TaxID=2508216 RepID=A0A6G5ZVF5_9EUGL|nr:NADH dehydrogenase subunit 3 [Diplonema japonicum]
MLYHHTQGMVALALGVAMMSIAYALAKSTASLQMLVHDVSSYDAGIPSSHHAGGSLDSGAFVLLWYLVLYEILLLWTAPALAEGHHLLSCVGCVLWLVVVLWWEHQ